MSNIFENALRKMGLGLDENELYNRAFEKGVLMKDFARAAHLFDDAAKKAFERANLALAARATANTLLYRYLTTGTSSLFDPLLKALRVISMIECIGLQQEQMPVGPLCAELECRLVEAAIQQVPKNDFVRLRDLHKEASAKFQAIFQQQLITYEYVKSKDGHDEKASMRHFYHAGMYQFCEAMIKKNHDPAAAADDLARALQEFRRCEDAFWMQEASTRLDNWRISRTCWICHREVQGSELNFSMFHAVVTPYTQSLLDQPNQDPSSANLAEMRIAVCTPCSSMITFRASEEAAQEVEKVRREMTAKLDVALKRIQTLERRVNGIKSGF